MPQDNRENQQYTLTGTSKGKEVSVFIREALSFIDRNGPASFPIVNIIINSAQVHKTATCTIFIW